MDARNVDEQAACERAIKLLRQALAEIDCVAAHRASALLDNAIGALEEEMAKRGLKPCSDDVNNHMV